MASIKDFRKIMEGLQAWNEAAGFIRDEDVERWNANGQITIKTFGTLLNMSVTAPTVRTMLFSDNMFLIGVAEGAAHSAPPQTPSATAREPEAERPAADRPREDFNVSMSYWTNLSQCFFLGQERSMADSLLLHCKQGLPQETIIEMRGKNFSYADLGAYEGPPGEQCAQMCFNV